ncbi:ATP-binding protein [bacterium]|nr:ATP-binding protein [bacterium]
MPFLFDALLKLLLLVTVISPFITVTFFLQQGHFSWSFLTVSVVILQALLLLAVGFLYMHRRTMVRLHDAVLDAHEGALSNLAGTHYGSSLSQQLVSDYNTMMKNLRAMFSMVEECQNRVVIERNKMDVLLGSMPGALLAVDDDLKVVNTNPQAAELFKCDSDLLLGKMLFDLFKLESLDSDALRDAFLNKRAVENYVIHTEVAGQERYISINIAFYSKDEAEFDAVITLQDITEYQQLLDSVYNREKLVAMGQLAAGIAHELNTPLGNILGYSQLFVNEDVDAEKRTRYSHFIADEARRCSRIINDLLSYARRDSCSSEACDVNALIRDLVDTFLACMLKRQATKIHLKLEDDLPSVEMSCGELDIAMSNLLLNAAYALEDKQDGEICVITRSVGARGVEVIVEDNGPGIPVENRRRIFEPFFTSKEAGDGTGLGLSISQAMLSRRGASLELDNLYKDGARFIVKLRGVKS